MKVIKIGGGCLKGKENIKHIIQLINEMGKGHIIVLSALYGVTDILINGMSEALTDESIIPKIMNRLKNKHMLIARDLISGDRFKKNYHRHLHESINKLERLYYGLNFTREMTPRIRDRISSYGERLSADLLTVALRSMGRQAVYRMPHHIGLVTDGRFGDATADLRETSKNLHFHLDSLLNHQTILFIPGFFGVSLDGDITTFGRGGTDYSAAVIAAALGAEVLEIWKDVPGYMTADPGLIPEAQRIPMLSYDEAAELSYFGAKILHPRTVEPIRKRKLNLVIRNTLEPTAPGSIINAQSHGPKGMVKSVTHDTDIGILKVHSSGVGARPGILAHVANQLTNRGINIKSVVTSQTCISLLLARKDLSSGHYALKNMKPKPFRRLEKVENVALVAIVGDGLVKSKGIAARCFGAVAECNVNVEMISLGPSRVALYFLVQNTDLRRTIRAIHRTFFSSQGLK